MEIDEIKRNIDAVMRRVDSAAGGRHVTVVAATKTVPADIINAAIERGITDVGENRVQEYLAKCGAVKGAKWHFIGALQSNKAKYLVGNVALIQSVDRLSLAQQIDALACKRKVVQDVLIEVNAGGEQSKSGVPIELACELIAQVRTLKNVRVRGIMSVPPIGAGDDVYAKLSCVFDKSGMSLDGDIFSVGMSGDYERAISAGSNMVRIGTALFGRRNIR